LNLFLSGFLYNFFFNIKAGLILACYLLGLGDRHNKNIMISKNGKIGHIDFGYIMNKDPISRKVLGKFTIKFNGTLIGPLLKDENKMQKPFDDEGFKKLIDACMNGFIALRSKSCFI
jgi:predicted unusual protein kinase regulating ubiquinone biosynthesis (AarF/ABC1/UbiB family)